MLAQNGLIIRRKEYFVSYSKRPSARLRLATGYGDVGRDSYFLFQFPIRLRSRRVVRQFEPRKYCFDEVYVEEAENRLAKVS